MARTDRGVAAAGQAGLGAAASRGGFTAPDWVVDEQGRLRRETRHHMGRRLPGWDYRRCGCYVITIVLADRREGKLGELIARCKPSADADGGRAKIEAHGVVNDRSEIEACGVGEGAGGLSAPTVQTVGDSPWLPLAEAKALKLAPDQVEARIAFSQLGRAIFDHFRRMGEFTPGLEPVYCAVMPEHLHLIVKVVSELKRPLGNAIAGFKTGCEKIYAKLGGEGRLFAEGFVDEICLRSGQLAAEFEYLRDNPRRLAIKRLFPELFKVSREIRVDFRLTPKGRGRPVGENGLAPSQPQSGRFSAIGNHFLLTRAAFHQVQVSRRFFAYARDANGRLLKDEPPAVATSEFAAKLDAALLAGKRGAVIVSPCISQGEREIARQAFAAGFRVVTLANKGFSPFYKPGGRLFESCAAGNLLMLAPVGWPYQPAERQMTRVDALILNRLAQLIAGEGSVEIDYKGVTLDNVDRELRKVI